MISVDVSEVSWVNQVIHLIIMGVIVGYAMKIIPFDELRDAKTILWSIVSGTILVITSVVIHAATRNYEISDLLALRIFGTGSSYGVSFGYGLVIVGLIGLAMRIFDYKKS